MGEYVPQAPINDKIRKQNENLPGMGGVFNYVNLHAYHYAGNNPVVLTDPDGKKQTEFQKQVTQVLSQIRNLSNKSDFSIVITRSGLDNGKNGMYYRSTLSVMYKGTELNSISIQSTADHPNTAGLGGKTLPTGKYTGTLLAESPSYLRPIKLVDGKNARVNDAFLFHPNLYTNKDNGGDNGPWPQPYSAGCQIPNLDDFNETMDILKAVGFRPGDTIDVIIRDPPRPRGGYYDRHVTIQP
jgi:hypothetical protein